MKSRTPLSIAMLIALLACATPRAAGSERARTLMAARAPVVATSCLQGLATRRAEAAAAVVRHM